MNNINRIDSKRKRTYCWIVRLRGDNKNNINKSFSDNVYGSKRKAFAAALNFRDDELSKISNECKTVSGRLRAFPIFRSKGYHYYERKRSKNHVYKAYRAFCYNMFSDTVAKKNFGVKKYGGKKNAKKEAIAFRNKERLKVEKYARSLGLIPSWIK